MEQISNIQSDLRSAKEALQNGDMQLAVRLSGEVLATTDTMWSTAYNAHKNTAEKISLFASASAVHSLSLLFASETAEAFNTSVLSLFQIAYDGINDNDINAEQLGLTCVAVTSFLTYLQNCPVSEDEKVREHVSSIARYLLSLHYHLYNKVIKATPECEYLQFAYNILKENIEHIPVDTPHIMVNGKETDPEKPLEIFSDLLGRIKALGLA